LRIKLAPGWYVTGLSKPEGGDPADLCQAALAAAKLALRIKLAPGWYVTGLSKPEGGDPADLCQAALAA
ncbi:hypothetical protein VS884_26470, partial [Escherichia coli]